VAAIICAMTRQGDDDTGAAGAPATSLAQVPPQESPATDQPGQQPVTRRGRLVLADYDADQLELETAHGRIELLGPFGTAAYEGDEIEVVGLPDPTARRNGHPALLIQTMRRL
jgi:hypothetical protein